MVKKNVSKKRQKKTVVNALAFISSSFNNTIVTVTDLQGNTLAWSSSGVAGFKGSRKSTPYAAQIVATKVVEKIKEFGVENLDVNMKGTGIGRETVLRTFQSSGLRIGSISDVTPVPHNGCRPPKVRRV